MTSIVGLLYNWAFFTLLGYSPFLMGIDSPIQLGLVFCGWGILVAVFAIWGAPCCARPARHPENAVRQLVLMAADLAVIAIFYSNPTVVIVCVIVAGIFIGVNNTLVTTAVMSIAPVERPVRLGHLRLRAVHRRGSRPLRRRTAGHGLQPRIPFLLGTATLIAAAIVLSTVHRALTGRRPW